MKITFGKFKGEEVCDLEISYLKWLEEQDWITKFPELLAEIRHEIDKYDNNRPGKGFVRPKNIIK